MPVAGTVDIAEGTKGLLVGFATQPDDVASDGDRFNGPYALALHDALLQIDDDLNSLLVRTAHKVLFETKGLQRPEHRVALTGPLYLVSRKQPLDCEVLAAEEDNNVSVKGFAYDSLDVVPAEKACRDDLARFPTNPRLIHNLARVLDKAGRNTEAVGLYRKSADLGYDWSQNNLAAMLLNGDGVQPDPAEAARWFRRSFEQGNRQALVNYTEHDLMPIFGDLPRPVTALQKGLRRAGQPQTLLSGKIDAQTLTAIDNYKRSQNIGAKGVTLQMLDQLGIVAEVFRGGSR